ncbi:UNVERIFIED_CONTAM: hypothetical protein FKN15_031164 [Acipenser sinensis]
MFTVSAENMVLKPLKSLETEQAQVVYITATFPFVMLIVLLIRGVTLPGAYEGIKFYLYPDLSRLADPEVWIDAGTQIFFSYAICLGAMTSLGSYNKYRYNCYRQVCNPDCLLLGGLNSGTSFVSGFAIFSVLGFMAQEQGVDIADVAESGPGLAFIAYPKAVSMMPLPTFWAILFFIMLLLLGLDSQFVEVEGQITSLVDLYPSFLRKGYRREIFIAIVCFLSYILGLAMVTNGCFIFSLAKYTPLRYNKVYEYPEWSIGLGWFLALSSMICIPMVVVIKIIRSDGPLIERIKAVAAPARGASSRPADYHPKGKESEILDPNGNNGLIKPTHTIVETMM